MPWSDPLLFGDVDQALTDPGVYLIFVRNPVNDSACLLKVGRAGIRGGKGLRDRLTLHRRQDPANTVFARHMMKDAVLGNQFQFLHLEQNQRRAFVEAGVHFRSLPMRNSTPQQIRVAEQQLEALNPRYIGEVKEVGYGPIQWIVLADIEDQFPEWPLDAA